MQVMKMIEENKLSLPFTLGPELGRGADGQCFSVNDEVVKCSIFYEIDKDFLDQYQQSDICINYLIDNPSPAFVRVYEHVYMGMYTRKVYEGTQRYIIHYHVMEKLKPLSSDENRVFDTIFNHMFLHSDWNWRDIKNILKDLGPWFNINTGKIKSFIEDMCACVVKHDDLHPRNLMKDQYGNFKMVDLDRLTIENLYENE